MGIAERLFKIIRSNITDGRPPQSQAGGSQEAEEPLWENPPPPPPNQDPEIAQYYANLEVPYGSNLETVKAGWKKLLKHYHPDLYGNDEARRKTAEELTRGLNHAYFELEKHLKTR